MSESYTVKCNNCEREAVIWEKSAESWMGKKCCGVNMVKDLNNSRLEELVEIKFEDVVPGAYAICNHKKYEVLENAEYGWKIVIGDLEIYPSKNTIEDLGIKFYKKTFKKPFLISGTIIAGDASACTIEINTSRKPIGCPMSAKVLLVEVDHNQKEHYELIQKLINYSTEQ